jgi:glycosyltransferase involved in cell wall biosynthesis
MKIGIDINPILDKIVGKGFFLKNILLVLMEIDKRNDYFLYGTEYPNIELAKNFQFVEIGGNVGAKWDLKCVASAKLKEKVDLFFTVKSLHGAILFPRSVLAIHDIGPIKMPTAYPPKTVKNFKRLLPLALKRSKKIIVPSSTTKSHIVNHYKISHKKFVKIPEAVPSWTKAKIANEDIERVLEKYNLPQNYFLFVGTLEPRKNLINLAKAFSEFKKDDKDGYKLVIVGKKGYRHEEIFKNIIDLNLSQDVKFTGHIAETDLKPLYILAKAFVFPSVLEGFGLSALEAMACEIPVICSKKGAIGETVGNACFEIQPLKIESITKALKTLAKDKELSKRLVKKGLKRVREFSWERSTKKLLKVFKEVAEM